MKPINLAEHPEGGRFQEVFRSEATITRADKQTRSALTHIYFSLNQGEVSRFHKVKADEVWNLYQGTGIYLYVWDGTDAAVEKIELSAKSGAFCYVVPAGYWQAAEPIDEKILVGCSVGPGFEFEDFELIDPDSSLAKGLKAKQPDLDRFISS